jgi:cobalt-zinc-cadmium efflux system outer membrane protein
MPSDRVGLALAMLGTLLVVGATAGVTSAQPPPFVTPAPPESAVAPSLTLDQAVGRFLERNLTVEAARHGVALARAEQIAAQLRPNPTLTVLAENLKIAGTTPPGQIWEVSTTYTQTIEWPEKRRLRREVADLGVTVAEAQLGQVLRHRLAEVKHAFYEALLARHGVENARASRESFEAVIRLNEARFQEGLVSEGELLKTRLEQARLDLAVTEAEQASRQAVLKLLEQLHEEEAREGITVTGELAAVPVTVDLAALRGEALRNAPALKRAAVSQTLADRRVSLEEIRRFPELAPFAGFKQTDRDTSAILGVQVPLPLFDRNQAGIARAETEARLARTEAALERSRVLARVDSAYHTWRSARDRVLALQTTVLPKAEESYRIALDAYEDGAVELLVVLEAERTRADIRRQLVQATFDYQTGLLALETAAGVELPR